MNILSVRPLLAAAFFVSAVTTHLPAASNSAAPLAGVTGAQYRNFSVAIYIPVGLVRRFAEPDRLEREWVQISSQLRVDKVYIESQRDRVFADEALLERVKAFFGEHGVRVAGGITFSDGGGGQFRSFCYTDPADRAFVQQATELTARHFDEIILDDFFFVTTKYPSDIAAKGTRSWTQFRLDLMNDAGRELVVKAAKRVNPRAKVIIKYPNWYEHFAASGFDLQEGPRIFDGIYTGTETRDPHTTDQFLQPYESYQVVRYFENIAPGRNGGGWVDTFNLEYIDRYAEQLWDTVLAKAPEMTLFAWSALLQPVKPGDRGTWSAQKTSFDYERMLAYRPTASAPANALESATMARAAGYALDQVDAVLGHLGRPIGIKSYRPPHATGDDYLHNYLGMLGIPIDLQPEFPVDASVVLLTEAARSDPDIVTKIERQLLAGKVVVVTAALYRALQGKGIERIVELEATERRVWADGYSAGYGAGERILLKNETTGRPPILFPQVRFQTNDTWALVSAMSDGVGFPLLLMSRYGNEGVFYVWNIPDNFHHLYQLPPAVTSVVKKAMMRGFPVRLDGVSEVALFAYDNRTFVVESFRANAAEMTVAVLGAATRLRDLVTGEILVGVAPAAAPPRDHTESRTAFSISVPPHSYRAFAIEP